MHIKQFQKRITKKLFSGNSGNVVRGTLILSIGSGFGRVIAIAIIPFLTRIYSPQDFGVLGVFISIVSLSSSIISLRYVQALPLPRSNGVAMNLLALCILLTIGINTVLFLGLCIWSAPLFKILHIEVLEPWWYLISIGIISVAIYDILSFWATRKRAYKVLARVGVVQTTTGSLVKLGLGVAGFHPLGLLLGQLLAEAGGIFSLLNNFIKDYQENWFRVSFNRILVVASRYKGFPIWRLPAQFLNTLSLKSPLLAFAVLFDGAVVGKISLAFTALAIPVNVFASTSSRAYYAEVSKLGSGNPKAIYSVMMTTLRTMLIIAFVPTLLTFLFGETIFTCILGNDWVESRKFAQILSFSLLLQLLTNPISQTFSVLGMNFAYFLVNLQKIVFTFFAFFVGYLASMNPTQTLLLFAICISIHRGLVLVYVALTLKRRIA